MLKPTKNFESSLKKEAEEFLRYGRADIKKFNLTTNFPCRDCGGTGIAREWTGIGSDYDKKPCVNCSRTGIVSREEFKKDYDLVIGWYNKELEEYKEAKQKYLAAKAKLTKEELDAILEWTS